MLRLRLPKTAAGSARHDTGLLRVREPAVLCIIVGLHTILQENPLQEAEIGIIGGSGLYSMPGLTEAREVPVITPFGAPSDAYVVGTLAGRKVAFLARHGRGHRLMPTELNYRANIHGLKQLGVERVISLSAVGSLKEEHRPLDFVVPDQFVDRTRHRVDTFFGDGLGGAHRVWPPHL